MRIRTVRTTMFWKSARCIITTSIATWNRHRAPVQSGETEQYEFAVAQSNSYFYRVTNSLDSDIVTYGNYADIGTNAQVAVEITKEMMYVGQDTNKNTVSDDFSKNQYDNR